jgi:hypothetical protein
MNGKIMIVALALMCIVAGLSGCVSPGVLATEVVTLHHTMKSNQVIDIQNTNGAVTLEPTNGSTITVQAKKATYGGSDDLKNINISITEVNNHVRIETVVIGFSTTQRSVDYLISVPHNATVGDVSTSNSAIAISGVSGDVSASTSNSQIIMHNISGYVSAQTSNSRIELTGTSGIRNVQTSNSEITVEVFGLADSTRIQTSNSMITILILPSLNVTLDAQTSDSGVQTEGLTLHLTTSETNHLVGTLGTGEKHLTVQTSNSRIVIRAL